MGARGRGLPPPRGRAARIGAMMPNQFRLVKTSQAAPRTRPRGECGPRRRAGAGLAGCGVLQFVASSAAERDDRRPATRAEPRRGWVLPKRDTMKRPRPVLTEEHTSALLQGTWGRW